jgi:thioredoxin 1
MLKLKLTNESFDAQVLNSDMPVLLDLGGAWSEPSKRLDPIIEELAAEYEGKVKVARLEVSENEEIVERLRLDAVPTLLFYKNGRAREMMIGVKPKTDLRDAVESLLLS